MKASEDERGGQGGLKQKLLEVRKPPEAKKRCIFAKIERDTEMERKRRQEA